ncbi:hypothetical protein CR513_00532, partial [Mucuna pruriens]
MVCKHFQLTCSIYVLIRASKAVKERLESDAKYYILDDPYLWRLCNDQVTNRRPLCINVDGLESPCMWAILAHYAPRHTQVCLSLRTVPESWSSLKLEE